MFDKLLIPVLASKVMISISGKASDRGAFLFDGSYIKCTAAEVIYTNRCVRIVLLAEIVKCSSRRFLNYAYNIQPCFDSCSFCCFTLIIAKISRHGYHDVLYRHICVFFGI